MECLILDILKETNHTLYNYLEVIEDPAQYIEMDDSIIHEVRVSIDPRLAKARQVVDRLDHRQLYSFVGEKGLKTEVAKRITELTEEQVIEVYKECFIGEDDVSDLKATDIIVRKYNINMGMKEKNPLASVSFYVERDGVYERVEKDPSEISMMMPEKCQATIVRLFVKDDSKFEQAKEAFRVFCERKLGGEPMIERG